jgi:hypothetical protein
MGITLGRQCMQNMLQVHKTQRGVGGNEHAQYLTVRVSHIYTQFGNFVYNYSLT